MITHISLKTEVHRRQNRGNFVTWHDQCGHRTN